MECPLGDERTRLDVVGHSTAEHLFNRSARSEFLPIRAAIVIAVGLLYHYIAVAKSATYNACGIQAQNYKLRITSSEL